MRQVFTNLIGYVFVGQLLWSWSVIMNNSADVRLWVIFHCRIFRLLKEPKRSWETGVQKLQTASSKLCACSQPDQIQLGSIKFKLHFQLQTSHYSSYLVQKQEVHFSVWVVTNAVFCNTEAILGCLVLCSFFSTVVSFRESYSPYWLWLLALKLSPFHFAPADIWAFTPSSSCRLYHMDGQRLSYFGQL